MEKLGFAKWAAQSNDHRLANGVLKLFLRESTVETYPYQWSNLLCAWSLWNGERAADQKKDAPGIVWASCQIGNMVSWSFVLAGAYIYISIDIYLFNIHMMMMMTMRMMTMLLMLLLMMLLLLLMMMMMVMMICYFSMSYGLWQTDRWLFLFEMAKTASTSTLPDTPSANLMTLCGQSQIYAALEDRGSFKACT